MFRMKRNCSSTARTMKPRVVEETMLKLIPNQRLFFQLKYRSVHPEDYLAASIRNLFSRSKHPKSMLCLNLKTKSLFQMSMRYMQILLQRILRERKKAFVIHSASLVPEISVSSPRKLLFFIFFQKKTG